MSNAGSINKNVLHEAREAGRQKLKALIGNYNKAQTDCELCKLCLKENRDRNEAVHWPNCGLATDLQLAIDKRNGLFDELDAGEEAIFEATQDPVKWAELFLDWKARWYQAELLRCTSQLKVIRAGRRIGKTDALVVDILSKCWTKPGKKENERFIVLVICPYERQVGVIFDRIRELVAKSDELKSSIERDIANPQRIEFANLATIIGIAAGVRVGAKADQVRGQSADYLALDEVDYLDADSVESIMAILTSTPNCLIWASSTPTGKREHFFNWCTNKALGFKSFHYKSSDAPTWTPQVELRYRQMYSEAGYLHEFDAEFGEEEQGVFQHQYIERSLYEYDTDVLFKRSKTNLYVMGVDWNSTGTGTHIIVVEYDTASDKMKVVYKEIIDPGQFTQHTAVARIIDLDNQISPDFIYVDQGFGTTQIEMLHEYGVKTPGSFLHSKVKGIDFGTKTQIRDPYTKKMVKKHTKPLVVEIAARRMESLQCIVPMDEDHPNGLVGQMRSFRVEKYGRDGAPIYSQGNEHTLIAWMLAVFGMVMEFTDIAKSVSVSRVHFVSRPGGGTDKAAQEAVAAFDAGMAGVGRKKKKRGRPDHLKPKPRWSEKPTRSGNTLSNLGRSRPRTSTGGRGFGQRRRTNF